VTVELLPPHARRPPEPDEDYPGGPLTPADRAAVRSAVSWLKAASNLVVLRPLLCTGGAVFVARITSVGVLVLLAAALAVHFVVSLSLLAGAEKLNRLSSRTWAVMACSLAGLGSLVELLVTVGVVWGLVDQLRRPTFRDEVGLVVIGGLALGQLVVLVVFLVASIKAFATLRRPAVWHGLSTNRG
jgi:hypothetical protein